VRDERLALLALTLTEGLGPARLHALVSHFGSAEGAVAAAVAASASGARWPPLPGLSAEGVAQVARRVDLRAAAAEAARVERVGARLVCAFERSFPAGWASFPDLPPLLYVRGAWPDAVAAWPPRAIAIVGSRRASAAGRTFAHDLGEALAAAGDVVVSGLALGIDAEAHAGAARAGRTLAVLPGGVDRPSPAANLPLARTLLAAGGALVSEMPLGSGAAPHAFPRRNRLVAALVRAVVVIEAGATSGAHLTAGAAAAYGRDVLVCPARPWDSAMAGNLALLRDGATPLCSIDDALGLLGLADARAGDGATPDGLSDLPAWALDALRTGPASADEVALHARRSIGATLAALELLVAAGAARFEPGGRYRLVGRGRSPDAPRPEQAPEPIGTLDD
jgi:DNA processing protein